MLADRLGMTVGITRIISACSSALGELGGALAAGVLPIAFGVAACGAGGAEDGGEQPLFSRADSAGVVILTTRGERARAPLG